MLLKNTSLRLVELSVFVDHSYYYNISLLFGPKLSILGPPQKTKTKKLT